jgi:hypothetical protein
VALDKSEGSVKDKDFLRGAMSTAFLPEGLRTKTLEISREITLRRNIVPPTIDSTLFVGHDSSMRTSRLHGMRERPINPAV